jgi:hypothetical protein
VTGRGVSMGEMKPFDDMSDQDVVRLLAGSAPEGQAGLDGVARFFAEAAQTYPEPATEPYEAAHIGAMLEAARLSGATADTAAKPAPFGLSWGTTLRDLFTRPSARVAALALAMAVVLGGTAYAGVLPAPVQSAVAHVAGALGIVLPDPSRHLVERHSGASAGSASHHIPGNANAGVRAETHVSGTPNTPTGGSDATGSVNSRGGTGSNPLMLWRAPSTRTPSSTVNSTHRKASHAATRRTSRRRIDSQSAATKDSPKGSARK